MRNSTKKNLKNLINSLNNAEQFIQILIDQKAPEDDVKAMLDGFKESFESEFSEILK